MKLLVIYILPHLNQLSSIRPIILIPEEAHHLACAFPLSQSSLDNEALNKEKYQNSFRK